MFDFLHLKFYNSFMKKFVNGIFVGKFLPPHKGHIWAIKQASQKCDKLFVVVCEAPEYCKQLCQDAHMPYVDLKQKTQWMKEELKDIKNVKVVSFDESGIKTMPNGWAEWSEKLKDIVGEKIDVIFGSETDYAPYYAKYFKESKYVLQDTLRTNVNISATKIRNNLGGNVDYIINSARPFFENYLKTQNTNGAKNG